MRLKERVGSILGGLVLIVVGIGLAWYEGPLVVRDFGIGSDVESAVQARLVKGRCQSRLILFICELNIDQNLSGDTRQTELDYLFVDMPFSHHDVRLLSPSGDRSVVTTDIGQDMLWNRALTLAGSIGFCVIGGVILSLRKGAAPAEGARGTA